MELIEKAHAEWAALSGLSPSASYSLADHAMSALVAEHGITGSLADLISLGIPTGGDPEPVALAHVVTAIGTGHFSSDPAPATHTVARPAAAVEDTYLIVEMAFRSESSTVANFSSIPAGWDTILNGSDAGAADIIRLGVFGRRMTASELASWDWSFATPANSIYQYRVFVGDNITIPKAGYLAQATASTTRATPTIVTEVPGIVCYSTHDRNSSAPLAPEEGSKVHFDQDGTPLTLTTSRVDPAVAGSYQRTFTGAVSTGSGGAAIYQVTGS